MTAPKDFAKADWRKLSLTVVRAVSAELGQAPRPEEMEALCGYIINIMGTRFKTRGERLAHLDTIVEALMACASIG